MNIQASRTKKQANTTQATLQNQCINLNTQDKRVTKPNLINKMNQVQDYGIKSKCNRN